MSLIKSISGIRGTIGGKAGENLTPIDIVQFTTAFVMFLRKDDSKKKLTLMVGRDARVSGDKVSHLVCSTLQFMGVDVVDLGLSTTPTVEMAVILQHADAGIKKRDCRNGGQEACQRAVPAQARGHQVV